MKKFEKKKSELKSVSAYAAPKPAQLAALPDVLNLDDVAAVLRTTRRGVYSLTRSRAQDSPNALRVLRLPVGLRVLRTDLENYLSAA